MAHMHLSLVTPSPSSTCARRYVCWKTSTTDAHPMTGKWTPICEGSEISKKRGRYDKGKLTFHEHTSKCKGHGHGKWLGSVRSLPCVLLPVCIFCLILVPFACSQRRRPSGAASTPHAPLPCPPPGIGLMVPRMMSTGYACRDQTVPGPDCANGRRQNREKVDEDNRFCVRDPGRICVPGQLEANI